MHSATRSPTRRRPTEPPSKQHGLFPVACKRTGGTENLKPVSRPHFFVFSIARPGAGGTADTSPAPGAALGRVDACEPRGEAGVPADPEPAFLELKLEPQFSRRRLSSRRGSRSFSLSERIRPIALNKKYARNTGRPAERNSHPQHVVPYTRWTATTNASRTFWDTNTESYICSVCEFPAFQLDKQLTAFKALDLPKQPSSPLTVSM